MTCPECNGRKLTESNFNYDYSTECGIDNIVVQSARRYDCQKCGNVLVNLGKLGEIDKELTMQIASTTRSLSAREMRFVRMRHFKESIPDFAKRLDTAPLTIAMIEENETMLTELMSDQLRLDIVADLATPKDLTLSLFGQKLQIMPKRKKR